MPEMLLERIRTSQMGDLGMILLRAKDDGSYLCLWTRAAEANAIHVKLQDVTSPRPMTHDLLPSIIEASGGTAHRVTISDIVGDTFYAKVVLHHGNAEVEVDARPSDAIALAVRSYVPIFVDDTVLQMAGLDIASASGVLEVTADGHGFLRQVPLFEATIDVYVSAKQIRHFGLNTGDSVEGEAWRLRAGERGCWLSQVEKINGQVPG
jgi:bifunctional DNase/RNase